jgi:hypothetical protein
MCPPAGSSPEVEEDPLAPPAPQLASGWGEVCFASQPASQTAGAPGSSTPASLGGVPSSLGVASQPDPGADSASLPAPTPPGSAVAIGSSAPPTSVALDVALSSTSRQGSVTWLQRGVSKPKTYTDGTVRWGMSASTIPE